VKPRVTLTIPAPVLREIEEARGFESRSSFVTRILVDAMGFEVSKKARKGARP